MTWFVLMCAGFGCLWMMKRTGPRGDWVLQRLAGGAFMAAGLAGLNGWLGTAVTATSRTLIGIVDRIGGAATGGAVAWVLVAGLGIGWVCAMLPDRVIKAAAPTWLVIGGVVLPGLLTIVPGALGALLRDATTWSGTTVADGIARLVS